MSWYYIDYENVNIHGITAYEKLKASEHLIIGRSNHINGHVTIDKCRCDCRYIDVFEDKNDALDFALLADIGMHLRKNGRFYIISKDRSFDVAIRIWQEQGYDISRATSLSFAMKADGYAIGKVGHFTKVDKCSSPIVVERVTEFYRLQREKEISQREEQAIRDEITRRENALVEKIFAELVKVEQRHIEKEKQEEQERLLTQKEKEQREQEEKLRIEKEKREQELKKKREEKQEAHRQLQSNNDSAKLMHTLTKRCSIILSPHDYFCKSIFTYFRGHYCMLSINEVDEIIRAFSNSCSKKEFEKNLKSSMQSGRIDLSSGWSKEFSQNFNTHTREVAKILADMNSVFKEDNITFQIKHGRVTPMRDGVEIQLVDELRKVDD